MLFDKLFEKRNQLKAKAFQKLEAEDSNSDLTVELAGRQRFLPLSMNRLIGILLNRFDLNDPRRLEWYRLFDAIAKVERMHLLVNFDLLSQLYDPFDPDKTYFSENEQSIELTPDFQCRLEINIRQLEETLNRANFEQIELDTVKHAVRTKNDLRLKYEPNFEVFDELRVYGRGFCRVMRPSRNWRKGFRREMKSHAAWNRLLVLVKFRQGADLGPMIRSDRVYLRMFKDVAFRELEMHLPEQATKLRMPLSDRFSIASPIITGVPMFIYKLYSTAIFISTPLFLGALVLPITKSWQSITGFRNARLKHMHQMISNLFYLTLANNRQCLSRILEMAWIQESMESMLAYWAIWHAQAQGQTINLEQLSRQVEQLIQQEIGIDILFQTHDAVDKLRRLNLLEMDGANLMVLPIENSVDELRKIWRNMSP